MSGSYLDATFLLFDLCVAMACVISYAQHLLQQHDQYQGQLADLAYQHQRCAAYALFQQQVMAAMQQQQQQQLIQLQRLQQ